MVIINIELASRWKMMRVLFGHRLEGVDVEKNVLERPKSKNDEHRTVELL